MYVGIMASPSLKVQKVYQQQSQSQTYRETISVPTARTNIHTLYHTKSRTTQMSSFENCIFFLYVLPYLSEHAIVFLLLWFWYNT